MTTTTTEGTVTSLGWEYHFHGTNRDGGNSDKTYRMFLIGNRVVVNWGRRGTAGQAQVEVFPTAAQARAWADKQAGSKEAKGYGLSIQPRRFNFDPEILPVQKCKLDPRGPVFAQIARAFVEGEAV